MDLAKDWFVDHRLSYDKLTEKSLKDYGVDIVKYLKLLSGGCWEKIRPGTEMSYISMQCFKNPIKQLK